MTSINAMFKASLLSIIRDKQLIGGAIAFPVIFLLAFAAFDLSLTGTDLGTGGGIDYFTFVVPGLLAMTAMEFSVSWTSASYARLNETKVLRRLDATPIRHSSFLTGQVASRILVGTVQTIAVIIVAMVLGADFAGNPVLLVGLSILAAAVFMPLGFAIGAKASGVESASVLSGMTVLPVVFLSGAFFPTSGLPDWLEPVVEVLPMAPLMEAMRTVAISGGGITDIAGNTGLVAAWIPVTFGLAVFAMRRPRTRVAAPAAAEPAMS
ncbi:MAG: ABC transporter permease [Actinomycetota bacterium]